MNNKTIKELRNINNMIRHMTECEKRFERKKQLDDYSKALVKTIKYLESEGK